MISSAPTQKSERRQNRRRWLKNTKGYVYILKSENGRYYIGSTNDLNRRIHQHKHKHTYTTTRMTGLELVFFQKFETIEKARIVERKIKSWKRKDFVDKIIVDGFVKFSGD